MNDLSIYIVYNKGSEMSNSENYVRIFVYCILLSYEVSLYIQTEVLSYLQKYMVYVSKFLNVCHQN